MKIIMALGLLAGCGNQVDVSAQDPSKTKTGAPIVASKTISIDTDMALYFELKSDIPDCNEDRNRQLVYVKEEAKFYYCDVKEWVNIDLKGDKGDAGTAGAAGKDGKDYDPNIVGNGNSVNISNTTITTTANTSVDTTSKSSVEVAVPAVPVVAPVVKKTLPSIANLWVDPASGYGWFLGNNYSRAQMRDLEFICPANAETATDDELKDAIMSGLLETLRGQKYVWIHGDISARKGTLMIIMDKANQVDGHLDQVDGITDPAAATTYHRALCLVKPQ